MRLSAFRLPLFVARIERSEIRDQRSRFLVVPGFSWGLHRAGHFGPEPLAQSGLRPLAKLGRASVARTKDFAFAQQGDQENDAGALRGGFTPRRRCLRATTATSSSSGATARASAAAGKESAAAISTPASSAGSGPASNPVARPAANPGVDAGKCRPAGAHGARERLLSRAASAGLVQRVMRRIARKPRVTLHAAPKRCRIHVMCCGRMNTIC
jgi:hypothetical protein